MVISEKQNIEFKQSWRDEYLKWVCGFANAQGGTIYIGVDDDGKVVGMDNIKRLLEDIPNKVNDTMGLVVDVNELTEDSIGYLEIVVPSSVFPISYRGEYHYRSGATKLQLRGNELTRFLIRKTGYHWDEEPVESISIDDLDKESFDIFLREARRRNRMEEDDLNLSRQELLSKLQLLTPEGQLTRAAVLLFYREPERLFRGAYIKIGMFRGADILYMDELHGSLFMQANQILNLIYTKYMYMKIDYLENRIRTERYSVPQLALREALYNAIMHSDYASGYPIQIRIENGSVTVGNSAQLPEGWTAETFLSPHDSKPYNRSIANAFFRAGFVETWGRGIKKMCDICASEGNPLPRYQVMPSGVMIFFGRNEAFEDKDFLDKPTNKVPNKVPETSPRLPKDFPKTSQRLPKDFPKTSQRLPKDFPKRMLDVLRILKSNPEATIFQLSAQLGVSDKTIKTRINWLKNNNYLTRIGGKTYGRWIVLPDAEIILNNTK